MSVGEEEEEGETEEETEGVGTMAVVPLHPAVVGATTAGRMGTGLGTARRETGGTSATAAAGMGTLRGAAAIVLGRSERLAD